MLRCVTIHKTFNGLSRLARNTFNDGPNETLTVSPSRITMAIASKWTIGVSASFKEASNSDISS